MARLDVVEGRLNDQTAALIQEQAEAVLEVKSGSGGDGCTEKPDGEGGDLLAHAKAGLGSFGENGLKFLKNRSSQGDGQNARLNHGGCLSREGKRDRAVPVLAIFFLVKGASFCHFLFPENGPNALRTAKLGPFSPVSPARKNSTRRRGPAPAFCRPP